MLNTLRCDRRTRRPAGFNLETLDDRLVLSAAAVGAVAGVEHRLEVQIARHEAKLDRLEARHEAKLATKEARQEAMISRLEVQVASLTPVAINSAGIVVVPGSASTSTSASAGSTGASASPSSTATPTPITTGNGSLNPGAYVPTAPTTGTGTTTPTPTPTTGSNTTSPGPLPANVSAALQSLYVEYEGSGGGSSFTPSLSSDKLLQISGDSVGVDLQMSPGGNFSTFLSQLQADGLTVSTSSATYGQVDGMLPISDLPTIAQVAASVTPMSPPVLE